MHRFAAGLLAALSLTALDASAVGVSKVSPVAPSKRGTCPSGFAPTCRTLQQCIADAKAGRASCQPAASGRKRAASPPKSCPKPAPGSKVTIKC
jgi:hypothetical protein